MSVLKVTKDNFNDVKNSDKTVLLDFYADWCGPCRMVGPIIEELATECPDVVFGKINVDEEQELAAAFSVMSIPTLVVMRNGEVVTKSMGAKPKAAILAMLDNWVLFGADMERIYDMIIIGGGPAGYTAALYSSRAGFDTLVLERMAVGGQMTLTDVIDNYPGFAQGIDGIELSQNMQQGAERFGTQTMYDEVVSVDLASEIKEIETAYSGKLYAKTVVIATGANPRELGLVNEQELLGAGIHYCAHCDGRFYKDKIAVVVGGGNSAVSDALYLSHLCKKVYLVHRRDVLRATKIYHEPVMKAENIEFCYNSVVSKVESEDGRVSSISLIDVKTNEKREIECDAVFISIGRKPATEFLDGQLELDRSGYIVADESTKTAIDGVFAVGDVRTKVLRQVVTAVSDGAVAAHYAEEYLSR